ncbi:hypothetical protein SOP87_30530, partial [Bacillus cereus]|uniref:hypothetical protein n=1 Tax=Bacillus cereus TaxID=1396 RepID=UPI002B24C039
MVKPLLWNGAKAIGKEALKTGANIITDMATSQQTPRTIVRQRVREAGQNLQSKAQRKIDSLVGSGIRTKPATRIAQLMLKRSATRIRTSTIRKKRASKKRRKTSAKSRRTRKRKI